MTRVSSGAEGAMMLGNATPLIALDAIVLDTETTGLDPAKARLIEFGAVRLQAGQLDKQEAFRRLVRPPQPIPPVATAFHGIDDDALASAPTFPEVQNEIASYLGKSLLIGHSLGFDLAVLKQEFRRAGRDWTPPRGLCTRLLVEIVEPDLPGFSLDQVANWLGVQVEARHTAVGDAATAARVFLALVPKLRDRGIRTLAEAELASTRLTRVIDEHVKAGWAPPVAAPRAQESPERPEVDLYPYRNRVRAVMSTPLFAAPAVTAEEAVARMTRERISSLLVNERAAGVARPGDTGIITERDIMRALATDRAAALEKPIGQFASRPLHTIAADTFVYRAIARMSRLRIRHLGLTGDDGSICGIVSARDLLRLRGREAMWLGDEIDEATDAASLGRAWAKVPAIAALLRREGVSGREVAGVISQELSALTGRAAQLVEQEMIGEGRSLPCRYAVAVLGSAGRGESLLALDQDNAVVYADDAPNAGEDPWFATFGQRLADILHEAGVPYCKGGVMASNPQWRGSLETWRARIADWINTSDPAKLLSVDIFFDLHGVHGERSLATTLWRDGFEQAAGQVAFAKGLVEAAGVSEPGLGIFGRFLTRNGRIDLKKSGLFAIVTMARVLAIRHHIVEHSTASRLEDLRDRPLGDDRDLEALRDAHGILLEMILDQQLVDIDQGHPPTNSVAVARLSAGERDRLRWALKAVRHLDTMTRDLLFET